MSRVTRGVTSHAKHKKILKRAKGFYGRRKNTIRTAKAAVDRANQYAYRDRRQRERQFRALSRGVHGIVATPGRLMDHMRRGTVKLDKVRFLVLDEADQMLQMGFQEDVEYVIAQLPSERLTALFSATMPEPIMKLVDRYMNLALIHI